MFGNIVSRMRAAKPAAQGGGVLARVFSQMRAKKAKPAQPGLVAQPQRRGLGGVLDTFRARRGY